MKAIWNYRVIAKANKEYYIYIVRNLYFPSVSIHKEFCKSSDEHATCYWMGEASYYNNYVDFWQGVEV